MAKSPFCPIFFLPLSQPPQDLCTPMTSETSEASARATAGSAHMLTRSVPLRLRDGQIAA